VTAYVDASVLLTRYLTEQRSNEADDLLASDPDLVTAAHTIVEVRRNLARDLSGRPLADASGAFSAEIDAFAIVELDATTLEMAATIAEQTGVRTLDAIHLGAAQRVGGPPMTFLTFDLRQAEAARALGFTVAGA
jgi:predicted nucleic acid-binding protein